MEAINKNNNFINKIHKMCSSKIFLMGVLCLTTLAYSMLYINTFVVNDGWGIMYVEQIFQGKVPYRDFYYYLPPLNLLVDAIFWKLSFGYLIIYRLLWLGQRIVIYLLVFNLLSKYFPLKTSFISCFFSVFLCTANVYDLMGDYNQTAALLFIILTYFASRFAEETDDKKKCKNLFFAGILIGLLFLCKQTVFVAACIVYFIALTVSCIVNKDNKYLQYISYVFFGLCIPIIISFLYLALNGAFVPFIEECFLNVDGKGSVFDILIKGPANVIKKYSAMSIVVCLFIFWKFASLRSNKEHTKNIFLIVAIVYLFLSHYSSSMLLIADVLQSSYEAKIIIICACFASVILYILKELNANIRQPYYSFVFFIFTIGLLISAACFANFNQAIYNSASDWFSSISNDFNYMVLIFLVIKLFDYYFCRNVNGLSFIVTGSLGMLYAGTMTSGGGNLATM